MKKLYVTRIAPNPRKALILLASKGIDVDDMDDIDVIDVIAQGGALTLGGNLILTTLRGGCALGRICRILIPVQLRLEILVRVLQLLAPPLSEHCASAPAELAMVLLSAPLFVLPSWGKTLLLG